MAQSACTVSRFENRNRVTSWRFSGWLGGQRVRKNFKTRDDASAEYAALEGRTLRATTGFRRITTLLSGHQLREAESAFRQLAGKPKGLSHYLNCALVTVTSPNAR